MSRRKIKTSVALDPEIVNWVKEMIKARRFATVTHAVEYGLYHLKEKHEQDLG